MVNGTKKLLLFGRTVPQAAAVQDDIDPQAKMAVE